MNRIWSTVKLPLVCCAAVFFAAPAEAQTEPSPDEALSIPPIEALTSKARELYIEGNKLYQQGKYDKALASFQAAWALKKHWQIGGMLGLCELKIGQFVAAATHIHFSISHADSSLSHDEKKKLQGILFNAKQQVGTLILPDDSPTGELMIDGKVVGRTPNITTVFVKPGEHEIRVQGNDNSTETVRVTANAGRELRVSFPSMTRHDNDVEVPDKNSSKQSHVHSEASEGRRISPDTSSSGGMSTRRVLVMSSAGVGLVGAGLGTFFALRRKSLEHDIRDGSTACIGGDSDACSQVDGNQSRLDQARTMTTVGLVAGAVGLGTSLGSWLLWPEQPQEGEPKSRSAGDIMFGRGKTSTVKLALVSTFVGLGTLSLGASVWSSIDANSKANAENDFLASNGGLAHICRDDPNGPSCSQAWNLHLDQRDAVSRTHLLLGAGVGLISTGMFIDGMLSNDRGSNVSLNYTPMTGGGGQLSFAGFW